MADGDFKDLTTRIAPGKILRDRAFNIARIQKHDGYQRRLASMIHKIFDNKTSGGIAKNGDMSNQELSEKLYKPLNRKFEKRKVYLSFIDVWGTDLADMHLISIIKEFFFYYVLLIFSVNMHGLFL